MLSVSFGLRKYSMAMAVRIVMRPPAIMLTAVPIGRDSIIHDSPLLRVAATAAVQRALTVAGVSVYAATPSTIQGQAGQTEMHPQQTD